MSFPGIKSWILDSIPDYSQKVTTTEDFLKFRSANQDVIAKVYLLSSKQQPPQIYSALTATYRDRIDFAFIIDDGSSASGTFKQIYGIETSPTLLVELQDGESREAYSGSMKLPELVAWLKPYALTQKI